MLATPSDVQLEPWQLDATGPATLAQVLMEAELQGASGRGDHMRPLPTGFTPLDDVLNGGVRPCELLMVGGAFGVGKTIWGMQVARNLVVREPDATVMYICYEHDRTLLMSRLLCLESAERGYRDDALTLRKLADLALNTQTGMGLVSGLKRIPRYGPVMDAISTYADRLILVKASGDHSSLEEIRRWTEDILAQSSGRVLLVVDYLQKIPVRRASLEPETEVTTYLTQNLKDMAMTLRIPIITIAASDREGLKSKRMRLSDLRGSSALQYEADIGLVLNNKYSVVSREHMVYNPAQAGEMRNWVVMSVEKNRAGRNAVDMEYMLDAAHFRMVSTGGFVRERLIDEKVTLE
jgi:replicative DNA helicase